MASSDSPVSRGTPTEEELRVAIETARNLAVRDLAAKTEAVLRWLSEHVSGLLEDRQRIDTLDAILARQDVSLLGTAHGFRILSTEDHPSIIGTAPGLRSTLDAARRALDSTRSPSEKQSVHPPVSSPPNQPGAR